MKIYKRVKFYSEAARRGIKFYAGCGAMPQQAGILYFCPLCLSRSKEPLRLLKKQIVF